MARIGVAELGCGRRSVPPAHHCERGRILRVPDSARLRMLSVAPPPHLVVPVRIRRPRGRFRPILLRPRYRTSIPFLRPGSQQELPLGNIRAIHAQPHATKHPELTLKCRAHLLGDIGLGLQEREGLSRSWEERLDAESAARASVCDDVAKCVDLVQRLLGGAGARGAASLPDGLLPRLKVLGPKVEELQARVSALDARADAADAALAEPRWGSHVPSGGGRQARLGFDSGASSTQDPRCIGKYRIRHAVASADAN